MSEVEKMYENANIKAKEYCDRDSDACMNCCPEWKNRQNRWKYKPVMPPFIAEKQLELIKWLVQNKRLCVRKAEYSNNFYMDTIINRSNGVDSKIFEVCLASLVNNLWQSLTEAERKQIKEILEQWV